MATQLNKREFYCCVINLTNFDLINSADAVKEIGVFCFSLNLLMRCSSAYLATPRCIFALHLLVLDKRQLI
jgi:hypothetical protein